MLQTQRSEIAITTTNAISSSTVELTFCLQHLSETEVGVSVSKVLRGVWPPPAHSGRRCSGSASPGSRLRQGGAPEGSE